MRYGKVAILMTIAAAALRCSGNPPVSEPGQAVLSAPSAVVINAIDHQETPAGTEVVLHGNYPFSYTSYQPDPRTLVLELLDVHVEGLAQEVQIGTPQVEGVRELQDQGPGVGLVGGVAERVVPVRDDLGSGRGLLVVDGVDDHRGRRAEHRLTRLADGRIARASQGGRGDRHQDRDLPVPHKLPSSAGVSFFVTSLYGLMLRGSLIS